MVFPFLLLSKIIKTRYANLILRLDFKCRNQLQQATNSSCLSISAFYLLSLIIIHMLEHKTIIGCWLSQNFHTFAITPTANPSNPKICFSKKFQSILESVLINQATIDYYGITLLVKHFLLQI